MKQLFSYLGAISLPANQSNNLSLVLGKESSFFVASNQVSFHIVELELVSFTYHKFSVYPLGELTDFKHSRGGY